MTIPWNLTPRQVQVLDALIEEGEHSTGIAAQLGISSKAVDTHLTRCYGAMGARSRVDAALMWDRWKRGQGVQA